MSAPIGFPGIGKLTIARALARLVEDADTTVRVVDNLSINNVIFRLVDQDGLRPLPDGTWDRVGDVAAAVLMTIETITPTLEIALGVPANCLNPGVRISEPGTGATVSGVIQIIGSASIPDFSYYKFEFQGNGFGDWTFIQRFDNSINGGILGAWDTRSVPSGDYEFRLVVVDKTGNYPEPCTVLLSVRNE